MNGVCGLERPGGSHRAKVVGSTPVGAAPSFRGAHNLPGILVVAKEEGWLSPNSIKSDKSKATAWLSTP